VVVVSGGRVKIVEAAGRLLELANFAIFLVNTELIGVIAGMAIEGNVVFSRSC
jgi:hypothetical protein